MEFAWSVAVGVSHRSDGGGGVSVFVRDCYTSTHVANF